VATRATVEKSELSFEVGFSQPEFAMFMNVPPLLNQLYTRLQPHGLKFQDIKLERGSGGLAEQNILFYLFDYLVTVRVRVERIEIHYSALPNREYVNRFKAATVDILLAMKELKPDLFRAYAVAAGIHAKLEGQPSRDYLAQFMTNAPKGLGSLAGNGAIFYFGPEGDRLLSTVTVDPSVVVPEAVFVKIHGLWAANAVSPEALANNAEVFIRQALDSIGLQIPED
jgi:hypothetical protein